MHGPVQSHATHLSKRAAMVALGRAPQLGIYSTDYPTLDGSGVRDCIHITNLANGALDGPGAPASVTLIKAGFSDPGCREVARQRAEDAAVNGYGDLKMQIAREAHANCRKIVGPPAS